MRRSDFSCSVFSWLHKVFKYFILLIQGIIVNAATLLKYTALAVLIIVYSYDCFNNVEKKYLKLNKALFNEVKFRIKDLEKVTSLPSVLQENRGFKSVENSEQDEYEMPDDVSDKPARHWMINDLVLFVDNEDMPRIPRKLFEDVCQIRVAGVPGPVYRGLMLAGRQFLKIVIFILFVFVVVLSFGNVYQVSSTNQMLAALAGGSLPFILRTVMEPEKPDIEIGTVSFKSQLDEIIKNFVQYWPIYDFPFDLYKPEEAKPEDAGNEANKVDGGSGGGDGTGVRPCSECAGKKDTANVFDETKTRRKWSSDVSDRDKTKPCFETKSTTVDSGIHHPLDDVDGGGEGKTAGEFFQTPPPYNNNIGSRDASSNHVDQSAADDSCDVPPVTMRKAGPKVCFEELPPEDPVEDVDIVIYLPERYNEVWLSQWSDLNVDPTVAVPLTADGDHRHSQTSTNSSVFHSPQPAGPVGPAQPR